jgi:hypothetical protein
MIGGIFIFGLIPFFILSVIVLAISDQFVMGLFTMVLGLGFIAAILMHVTLDVLKRLEFKEI